MLRLSAYLLLSLLLVPSICLAKGQEAAPQPTPAEAASSRADDENLTPVNKKDQEVIAAMDFLAVMELLEDLEILEMLEDE